MDALKKCFFSISIVLTFSIHTLGITQSFRLKHNINIEIVLWKHAFDSFHQYFSSSSIRLCVWTTNLQARWAFLPPCWPLSIMFLHWWGSPLSAQALPLRCMFTPNHAGVLPDLWRYSLPVIHKHVATYLEKCIFVHQLVWIHRYKVTTNI